MKVKENELLFAKVKEGAIIPTKKDEDVGYDIYACFDEDFMVIPAYETVLIPTGIASAFDKSHGIILKDRGSNGSKGIHVYAGVIDSGFRGEWFVAWHNSNEYDVLLSKLSLKEIINKYGKENEYFPNDFYICFNKETHTPIKKEIDPKLESYTPFSDNIHTENHIIYPYNKGIAQAVVIDVPAMDTKEATLEELQSISSKRGTGSLGSSGK